MKNFSRHGLLAFCLLAAALVFAQDQNSVMEKGVVESNKSAGYNRLGVGERQVLTPVEQKMQKLVSVDFRNTPMEDVIRILAQQADIDIVKSPSVTGNVTATLTNVPLGEALSNILAAHGYAYVADQHLIRVVTRAEVGEQLEALVSKVYQITYADVKDVENAIKKFLSPRGQISANPGTNNIIVTDTESKIKAIDTFILEIDRMTPQVLVEARIYDITSTENFDLGIAWQAGTNTQFDSTTGAPTGDVNPFNVSKFASSAGKANSASGTIRFGWINEHYDIEAMIKAQKENIEAKLLANPRVLVLDNETANIEIVHEIPYQQLNQGLSTNQFGTIEFKEVGVKLKVTPHITREGMVRLNLRPEFSVQAEDVTVGSTLGVTGEGSSLPYKVPSIDKRTANTTLLVKDTQTVVLGGLRKKDVSKQVDKIPLLGDIPAIGWLFKFTAEKTIFSEIVVFVTPRIISKPLMTEDMTCPEKRAYEGTQFPGPKSTYTGAELESRNYKVCPEESK